MTNLDRFNEAFGHMGHVVMGRRLAKFSLRHRFWLEAMESPLVTGGEARLMDLELASLVCAIPYHRIDSRLPAMLARGPRWWQRLCWIPRAWRRNVAVEYRRFQEYLFDHGCPPSTWEEECANAEDLDPNQVERGPLPGLLPLVTGLMRGTGWEPDTVWSLSPGEAEWYLAGVFLHRGVDIGLKTAEDEAMEEMLRKRAAAVTPGEEHASREDRSGGRVSPEGAV